LATRRELTASLAVLAVLVPRPVPQLKLWLPMVPQVYTYAPLIAALVLWSTLTAHVATPAVVLGDAGHEPDDAEPLVAVSAA
jgi:hypothetical protein